MSVADPGPPDQRRVQRSRSRCRSRSCPRPGRPVANATAAITFTQAIGADRAAAHRDLRPDLGLHAVHHDAVGGEPMRVLKYAAATLAAAALVPARGVRRHALGHDVGREHAARLAPHAHRAHHPPGRAHQRGRHEGAPAPLERVRRLRADRRQRPAGRERVRRPPGRHDRGGRARDADAGHVRRAARRARRRGQRRGQRPDPARGGRRGEPRGLDLRPGDHAQRELSQRRAPALVHDARGRRRPRPRRPTPPGSPRSRTRGGSWTP